MNVVTSGDCTAIVFDRIWDGAPLISSAAARPNPFGASAVGVTACGQAIAAASAAISDSLASWAP